MYEVRDRNHRVKVGSLFRARDLSSGVVGDLVGKHAATENCEISLSDLRVQKRTKVMFERLCPT